MAIRTRIHDLLHGDAPRADVTARGWVRTRRDAKDFSFLELGLRQRRVGADGADPRTVAAHLGGG